MFWHSGQVPKGRKDGYFVSWTTLSVLSSLCPTKSCVFGIQTETTSSNREARRGLQKGFPEHPNFTEMQFMLCIISVPVMSRSKGPIWDARTSGGRCLSPKVQRVTPVVSLSRTRPSAPRLTLEPPQTGAPALAPDESPSERNSNFP